MPGFCAVTLAVGVQNPPTGQCPETVNGRFVVTDAGTLNVGVPDPHGADGVGESAVLPGAEGVVAAARIVMCNVGLAAAPVGWYCCVPQLVSSSPAAAAPNQTLARVDMLVPSPCRRRLRLSGRG
ncbi:hypothetical protein GCM10027579_05270 [Calidifontibacter terrae]